PLPAVSLSGGGGTGAVVTPVISGSNASIQGTHGGRGGGSGAARSFTGGQPTTPAGAALTFKGTTRRAITLTDPGSGYTSIPTLTFTPAVTGTAVAATILLTPSPIASISIPTGSGGTGYSSASPPTVNITGGGGTGATATAIVTGTTV